jgi:oxygen-dependent protoporphyrinogen oxidase
MGELVDSLSAALRGVRVVVGDPLVHLGRGPEGFRLVTREGRAFTAQAVVLATPAHASAQLLEPMDADLAGLLESIEYASAVTVSLAYRRAEVGHPVNGHGYLVPRAEGRPVLACTWSSQKFPHRAPVDHHLLRVFIGRAGQEPESDPRSLVATARQELARTMGIRAEPLFARVYSWPRALPQYTLGHPQRIGAIRDRLEQHPGLFLAGAAFDGVGVPDCIRSGQLAAQSALDYLEA